MQMGAMAQHFLQLAGETGFEPALTPVTLYGLEARYGTPPGILSRFNVRLSPFPLAVNA